MPKIPSELLQFDSNPKIQTEADKLVAQHHAIGAMNSDVDPRQVYSVTEEKGAPTALEETAQLELNDQIKTIREYVRGSMEVDPEEGAKNVEVLQDAEEEIRREAGNPTFAHKALLRNLTEDNPDVDEDLLDFEAEQMFYSTVMAGAFDKDWWGSTKDFIGMMFMPNESFIARDLVEGDGWWSSADDASQFASAFQALSQEERLNTFASLVEAVKERTPNDMKAVKFLNQIVDPMETADIGFAHAMDKAALGGIAIDAATLGTGIARRASSAVRILSRVGQQRKAAEVLKAAAKDPDVAKAAGLDDIEAQPTPFNLEINGVPEDVQQVIARDAANTNRILADLDKKTITEGIHDLVTDPDAAINRMQREILGDNADSAVYDIRHVSTNDTGATFKYRVTDSSGTYEREVTKPFVINDITGGFNVEGYRPRITLGRLITSPNLKFDKDAAGLVHPEQRGLFQTAKYRQAFNRQMGNIFRIAPKAERTKVAKALEEGNLNSTVHDYATLKSRYGMDDKGVQQYYEFRNLLDQAWGLKNKEVVNRNRVVGNKVMQMPDETNKVVRPYNTPKSAKAALQQDGSLDVLVYNANGNTRPVNMRATADGHISSTLDDLMEDGYVLVRGQGPSRYFKQGENYYSAALVKREKVSDITDNTPLINYERGYVPIMYDEANYFGSKATYGNVDGVTKQVDTATTTYFTNRTDADTWARNNNLVHLENKYGSKEKALEMIDDPRETLPYSIENKKNMAADEFDQLSFGGLYVQERAQQRLNKGLENADAEFKDPFFSIQSYLDNIANNLPMSSYRAGLERKWMEHAKATGALDPKFSGGFKAAIQQVQDNPAVNHSVRKYLEDSHAHISYNNRVPTLGEEETAGRIMEFAERLEGVLGKENKLSASLQRLDHANVPDAIRATSFHTLLGAYNPAQIVIQGFGATVAMSINPVYATRGFPYASAFSTLDQITDTATKAKAMERMESFLPGVTKRYKAWEATGFHDDAVNASADYMSQINSHPMSNDTLQNLRGQVGREFDRGTVFYKSGELFNRRVSFATAIERHIDKGGALDNQGLKSVMDRTNTTLLHMDRANKAEIQKGWWSVPTQYMQVHTKFIEALLGKQLTMADKSKLMAGQLALFGSLGVPFGDAVLSYFLDEAGMKPGDIDGETTTALNEGAIGYALRELFEINVEAAPRGAIPFGLGEAVERFLTEDAQMWEVLAGASGVVPDRMLSIANSMTNLMSSGGYDPENYGEADVKAASKLLLEFLSSTRNALSAYQIATNDVVRDSKGRPLMYTDDINTQTMFARGLGFSLNEVSDMYDNLDSEKKRRERITNYVDKASDIFYRLHGSGSEMDKELGKRMEIMMNMMLDNESPAMQKRVRESFISRITGSDNSIDQANRAALSRALDETYNNADLLNRNLNNLMSGSAAENANNGEE